jgi:acyl-coenzyme A synthetase/AMP-(fatty) acid ligase
MGDVGYLDGSDRFWCCGRKSHRVTTNTVDLFTEPCEAIFNTHPRVHRTALVGVGEPGSQTPVLIAEPWKEHRPVDDAGQAELLGELKEIGHKHATTESIEQVKIYPDRLPTDIRHNSKIFREQLAPWAEQQLRRESAS